MDWISRLMIKLKPLALFMTCRPGILCKTLTNQILRYTKIALEFQILVLYAVT